MDCLFDVTALTDQRLGPLGLRLGTGECLGIAGPSGASKRLLLRALAVEALVCERLAAGAAALWVSHDEAQLARIATRVLLWLFSAVSPWFTLATGLTMILLAGREVQARQQRRLAGPWATR